MTGFRAGVFWFCMVLHGFASVLGISLLFIFCCFGIVCIESLKTLNYFFLDKCFGWTLKSSRLLMRAGRVSCLKQCVPCVDF